MRVPRLGDLYILGELMKIKLLACGIAQEFEVKSITPIFETNSIDKFGRLIAHRFLLCQRGTGVVAIFDKSVVLRRKDGRRNGHRP